MAIAPKFLVIDDFLPAALAEGLLAHALANEADFQPSEIRQGGQGIVDPSFRRSHRAEHGLGPWEKDFAEAISARLADLSAGTGLSPFPVARTEAELSVHGDGGFYETHSDAFTAVGGRLAKTDRVLTCVYYFHTRPAGFSGGELELFGFGAKRGDPPVAAIVPLHNRLAAFPAIVPHRVAVTHCPGNAFASRRFSINCWLHRARQ